MKKEIFPVKKEPHIYRTMTYTTIISILILNLLTNCSTLKTPGNKKTDWDNYKLNLLAWNEDTVNNYQFAIVDDTVFYYSITKKSARIYQGKVSVKSSLDTLFLDYYKNRKPANFRSYLVREASGLYYIQFFDNSPKRIFLRRQRLGHRAF